MPYQELGDLVLDYLPSAEWIGEMVNVGGTLPNYPLVDQLHEPTDQGAISENARFNCVFCSNSGVVKFLCKPNHQDVNGDHIKDNSPTYGPAYQGGSSQERIAPFVEKTYQVHTEVMRNSDRSVLLKWLLDGINAGQPSIITMPSAWNTQPSKAGYNPNSPNFPTHAGTAFGFNPQTRELLVANPWGGFIHRGSYDYWIARLCYAKVYRMSLIGAGPMPLPTGWKDSGTELTQDQTPYVVVKGFRNWILDAPYWSPDDVPIMNEHTLGADEVLELSNPAYGATDKTRVQQRYRRSWLSAREQQDGKWVTGAEWVGVEADYCRKEIARLNAILDAATAPGPTPPIVPVPVPKPVTSQEAYDKVGADFKDGGYIE